MPKMPQMAYASCEREKAWDCGSGDLQRGHGVDHGALCGAAALGAPGPRRGPGLLDSLGEFSTCPEVLGPGALSLTGFLGF